MGASGQRNRQRHVVGRRQGLGEHGTIRGVEQRGLRCRKGRVPQRQGHCAPAQRVRQQPVKWLFNGLKNNGGKWDVIGMSLYPSATNWQTYNDQCIANANDMITRYGTEVMICEVGMPWDEAATAKLFLTDLITRAKAIANDKCLGLFYWEPQSYNNWNGYSLGAFDASGKPTVALMRLNYESQIRLIVEITHYFMVLYFLKKEYRTKPFVLSQNL
jgi:phosphodiesterase/alkaline phosphatase D-like protein